MDIDPWHRRPSEWGMFHGIGGAPDYRKPVEVVPVLPEPQPTPLQENRVTYGMLWQALLRKFLRYLNT